MQKHQSFAVILIKPTGYGQNIHWAPVDFMLNSIKNVGHGGSNRHLMEDKEQDVMKLMQNIFIHIM